MKPDIESRLLFAKHTAQKSVEPAAHILRGVYNFTFRVKQSY